MTVNELKEILDKYPGNQKVVLIKDGYLDPFDVEEVFLSKNSKDSYSYEKGIVHTIPYCAMISQN